MKKNKIIYPLLFILPILSIVFFACYLLCAGVLPFGFNFSFSFIALFALLPLTILPVLLALSDMDEKKKDLIGFGLPFVSGLVVIGLLVYAAICTGKMCEFVPAVMAMIIIPPTVIFLFLYTLVKVYKKGHILSSIILAVVLFSILLFFIIKGLSLM